MIALGGGSLSICGETLTAEATIDDLATAEFESVDNASSALEALCVQVEGDPRLLLARELTVLALNCIVSGFGADCSGADASLADLFSTCNASCTSDPNAAKLCLARIESVSNECAEGELPAAVLTGNAASCPDPGPAGGSGACAAARRTRCTIVAPGRDSCRAP